MGNICSASQSKHGRKVKNLHPRDYQPDAVTKKEDLDHAIAKEETTTSYENITKIYNFKKELGNCLFYSSINDSSRTWTFWNCKTGDLA